MSENKINSYEKFVRWQSVLREQLTFLNNLVLTLSVGTIGFVLSLLGDKDFNPVCFQKIFLTTGLMLSLISLVFGFCTSFSRLSDYRVTVQKIKNETTRNFTEHAFLKKLMDIFGKTTWVFFYLQIILFCVAILSLTISFLMVYNDKLF